MAEDVKISMTPDEWGQVLMVMQGGVYRVVAPIIMKLNNQLIAEMQRQQAAANIGAGLAAGGPRLVEPDSPMEVADD